ncbi:ATP-binding cassette, subfamily B [Fontibacillus panacisegetis]|uniref:ATP-binding cassette, subfamily B n=1 Tax=Fontibacillus panacisegetis TaxID=670482 RepID=A0A1G7KTA8_9BACL|nr:ABC transporter ATP-binding protein [Fontibacillus panacisegetis]SDF40488.1 ATP-binding cassette, subfamily B [Fontibacillus panacisegetis]
MLRRFFSYYKPYRNLFILDFTCAVVAGLLELGFPIAVNQFVDKLLPGKDWSMIIWASALLLGIYVLNTVLNYIVTYWGHMLGVNIETDMRKKMFEHLQKLSFRFYDNNKTGHLMSRISRDLDDIGEVAHHGPEDVFIAGMTLIGSFILMLTINWQLAVLTFLIVPVLVWTALYFNRKMTSTYRGLFSELADFNARVEENIGGIRVVQAFANEEHEKKLFAENNGRYRATKMMAYKIMAGSLSINYMLMRLVSLFVMICGTWFVIRGELSYGEFIGFLLLSNVFIRPIEKINAIIESYPKGIAGFKRYVEIIDTEPDVANTEHAEDAGVLRGDIQFDRVTFGYEGSAQVLKDINLNVRAGETIAFVGPSGAGKTTLCSLLPRFYEVDRGQITIDGIDIRDMTLSSLRRNIGIVQQDVYLFSGTIRENILYGKLGASDTEVWEAARRAQLEEFILAQATGMDTIIGERGVKLSGGQKQRLAIARMFLKNPPILILDEATSALDTETELAIQQSLSELSAGRTTLVIAHRLATIKNADRIVVVTEDGISEEGRHQELVTAGGHYSRLHQAQFGVQ